jgi:hypothetical protein
MSSARTLVSRDRRRLPGPVRSSLLAGCAALGSAVAVLLAAGPAGAASPAWSVSPTPQTSRGSDQFAGVSCTGASFCTAVGSGYYRRHGRTVPGPVAESWNGRAWSVTRTRIPGGDPDEFDAVSCTGPSFCVAVGRHYHGGPLPGDRALVETWNGRAWSVTPSPRPGFESILNGVSCAGARSCQAVGGFESESAAGVLTESWNGRAWTRTGGPRGGANSLLQGVSCARAARCMAVGFRGSSSGSLTLAESWDGHRWSVVPTPNRPEADELNGVSCASATSCAAVGDYAPAPLAPPRTLAESWDGRRWALGSSPDRGTGGSVLAGVSCTAGAGCVAAGYSFTGSGDARTLIETRGASGWSITPSPDPTADARLAGASCAGTIRCTAAGYHGTGSLLSDKTLVEIRH